MSSKSKSKHELREERLQRVRNRIKPLMIEEERKRAINTRIRSYYRQLQGNEPIGRIEREEWEQSQRNLENKVPEALEAFKSAKQAIRTGTKIVEPRTKIVQSTTVTRAQRAAAAASSLKSAAKSAPKSAPKSSSQRSVTNKNKNKKVSESRATEAPVSSSSTKKHKTFFNILRNVAKKILGKFTGKTRKNNKG